MKRREEKTEDGKEETGKRHQFPETAGGNWIRPQICVSATDNWTSLSIGDKSGIEPSSLVTLSNLKETSSQKRTESKATFLERAPPKTYKDSRFINCKITSGTVPLNLLAPRFLDKRGIKSEEDLPMR